MTVYVPRWKRTFIHPSDEAAYRGFVEVVGEDDIQFYDPIEDPQAVDRLPLNRESIVVGNLSDVRRAVTRITGQCVELPTVPRSLFPFAGRSLDVRTVGEVREGGYVSVFMKPYDRMKLFPGRLVKSPADWPAGPDVTDDVRVLVSEEVRFVSEHRVFVLDGEPCAIRFYDGDPEVRPDISRVREIISAYSGAPAAYALDVGVLAGSGETVVVEVNDIGPMAQMHIRKAFDGGVYT